MTHTLITTETFPDGTTMERPLTPEELATHEADIAEFEASKAKKVSDAIARTVLLARLGITEEEAELLK